MEISQAINEAQSLEQVVAIVNDGGTSRFDQNEIAAQYAYDAADDAGFGLSKANIEAHLDVLVEAGAEFDYLKAVELATAS
ncbi:hypothetical protein MHM93_14560 [Pseudoalteromonas sp. MM17-2]|uniref:hypothetical protein n=1 Tax=Pseudoalteromonas sp. MM17-2 TaxID=2917753 RepID=UPI001EF6BC67|nr:hypothetical protein [Pseudoalteromonas sp. MM17-2]MCG7545400.1 hypothetical protein [Pseudoalteromonas sp. MM17-2]